MKTLIIVIIIVLLALLAIKCIRITNQQHNMIVERLGKFHAKWEPGIHFLIPIIDKVVGNVSLKERVIDIAPQYVITQDNCGVQVDAVMYYIVNDAYKATYGIEDAEFGVKNLVATTLRNIIGAMELDETLSGRTEINTTLADALQAPTDEWGITVLRAEIRDVRPPSDVQSSMEKQMKAERDKRSEVLTAEADKAAKILRAEGEKEAAIRSAEGEKQAAVLKAEGYNQAKVLEADAEAKATVLTQEARANGLKFINEARVTAGTIKLEQLAAVKEIASSPSSKTVIPIEMEDLSRSIERTSAVTGTNEWMLNDSDDEPEKLQESAADRKHEKIRLKAREVGE